MATYDKYAYFVSALTNKEIDAFGNTDTFKAIIHTDNTTLAITSVSKTACTQIGAGSGTTNGYAHDGIALVYTCANPSGTVSFAPTSDTTWTASGGSLGNSSSGRYFSIYDDTATTPNADVLMCKFDYAATFTVASGETMTLDYDTNLFQLV